MKKKILGASALLAAGLVAGGLFSVGNIANAADSGTSSSDTSTSAPALPTPPNFGDGDGGPKGGAKGAPMGDPFSATPIDPNEKAVDADLAAKLTAAAEAKVPGATVIRAETDAHGAAFEVHMKKADGSVVTVEFDSDLNITGVEDGFGPGPKGPHGPHDGKGPHGPNGKGDNDGDGPGFTLPSPAPSTGTNN